MGKQAQVHFLLRLHTIPKCSERGQRSGQESRAEGCFLTRKGTDKFNARMVMLKIKSQRVKHLTQDTAQHQFINYSIKSKRAGKYFKFHYYIEFIFKQKELKHQIQGLYKHFPGPASQHGIVRHG